MKPHTVIVVGASAGGVDAIGAIVSDLPADFAAAVLVVLHIGAHNSNLPWLLNRQGPIEAVHPADGDPVEAGRVYVAPPDHHLTVEEGVMRLTKGPRENFARPAIDPLFRSAAQAYGSNLIGVMLTGGLNDGTAGMYELKQHGGLAIVQDPEEAVSASMPRSVMAHIAVDHCLPLAEIAPLLVRLVSERAQAAHLPQPTSTPQVPEMTAEFTHHRPIAVTCPDCGGALRRRDLGTIALFECHIGHRYTAEVMLAAQFLSLERSVEMAMRSLGERAELCRQMADKTATDDTLVARERWTAAMREARDQTEPLRILIEREWIHPDTGELDTLAIL